MTVGGEDCTESGRERRDGVCRFALMDPTYTEARQGREVSTTRDRKGLHTDEMSGRHGAMYVIDEHKHRVGDIRRDEAELLRDQQACR